MSEHDQYLLDPDGQPYRYADGRPVKLDDFDQEPSWKARAEVKVIPVRDMWQRQLDAGFDLPEDIIRDYNLKRPD